MAIEAGLKSCEVTFVAGLTSCEVVFVAGCILCEVVFEVGCKLCVVDVVGGFTFCKVANEAGFIVCKFIFVAGFSLDDIAAGSNIFSFSCESLSGSVLIFDGLRADLEIGGGVDLVRGSSEFNIGGTYFFGERMVLFFLLGEKFVVLLSELVGDDGAVGVGDNDDGDNFDGASIE